MRARCLIPMEARAGVEPTCGTRPENAARFRCQTVVVGLLAQRLRDEDQKHIRQRIGAVEAEHQRLALLLPVEDADQDVVKRHRDD